MIHDRPKQRDACRYVIRLDAKPDAPGVELAEFDGSGVVGDGQLSRSEEERCLSTDPRSPLPVPPPPHRDFLPGTSGLIHRPETLLPGRSVPIQPNRDSSCQEHPCPSGTREFLPGTSVPLTDPRPPPRNIRALTDPRPSPRNIHSTTPHQTSPKEEPGPSPPPNFHPGTFGAIHRPDSPGRSAPSSPTRTPIRNIRAPPRDPSPPPRKIRAANGTEISSQEDQCPFAEPRPPPGTSLPIQPIRKSAHPCPFTDPYFLPGRSVPIQPTGNSSQEHPGPHSDTPPNVASRSRPNPSGLRNDDAAGIRHPERRLFRLELAIGGSYRVGSQGRRSEIVGASG